MDKFATEQLFGHTLDWENTMHLDVGTSREGPAESLADEVRTLVTLCTEKEYKRIVENWRILLVKNNHINPEDDPFEGVPSLKTPLIIIEWIMEHCDSNNPDGTQKPETQHRFNVNHAQKMRAVLAHGYGKSLQYGTKKWTRIPNSERYEAGEKLSNSERYEGNPTTSILLHHYMESLRRRKHEEHQTVLSGPLQARHVRVRKRGGSNVE